MSCHQIGCAESLGWISIIIIMAIVIINIVIVIIIMFVIVIIIVKVSESSDRLKRERWMDQKAKKIKDQTVRSLESEVQKIMNRCEGVLNHLFFWRNLMVFVQTCF